MKLKAISFDFLVKIEGILDFFDENEGKSK